MEIKLAKKTNFGLAECEEKNPSEGGYGKEVKIENTLLFYISPIFLVNGCRVADYEDKKAGKRDVGK